MVDEYQSLCSRYAHSPSRPQDIPLYGCQSFLLGAHLEPMSLSFHGLWLEDQSQLHINMLEMMAIRFTLIRAFKYIHHPCVMISTDNTTVVSYINKQGGTHSPNLCVEVWKILQWCLKHHIVIRIRHIPGKFNVLADRLSRIDKIVKTEWALDQSIANSIFQMFNCPNLDQPASVAQLDARSDWRPGGHGFNPRRGRQHSFVEIDHEIFSFSPFR